MPGDAPVSNMASDTTGNGDTRPDQRITRALLPVPSIKKGVNMNHLQCQGVRFKGNRADFTGALGTDH